MWSRRGKDSPSNFRITSPISVPVTGSVGGTGTTRPVPGGKLVSRKSGLSTVSSGVQWKWTQRTFPYNRGLPPPPGPPLVKGPHVFGTERVVGLSVVTGLPVRSRSWSQLCSVRAMGRGVSLRYLWSWTVCLQSSLVPGFSLNRF